MTTCTAEALHAHADAIEHAAALGGYSLQETRGGPTTRRVLSPEEREQWARDAAVLRQAAYRMEGRDE